jgi:hypothetical protein
MFVSFVYMLSCVGRGLSDGLITRPEESYRVSNSVGLRNLKGGGQGPMWSVEPLEGGSSNTIDIVCNSSFACLVSAVAHKVTAWLVQQKTCRSSLHCFKWSLVILRLKPRNVFVIKCRARSSIKIYLWSEILLLKRTSICTNKIVGLVLCNFVTVLFRGGAA